MSAVARVLFACFAPVLPLGSTGLVYFGSGRAFETFQSATVVVFLAMFVP